MSELTISKVAVDEADIYNELARRLGERGTWKDLLPTNVGATILSMASASTTVNQHYINAGLREAFLRTAVRDSSIFEGTSALGVQIARRVCAGVTTQLQNNLTAVKFIAPYSQFYVGSELFFNREQLMIPAGASIEGVQLFQGEIRTFEFDIDSLGAQELHTFKLGLPGFSVAQSDLIAYVEDKVSGNTVVWNKTDVALFELGPTDRAYYEFTSGDGDVALMFGTGEYGARLPSNSILKVRCVLTNGSSSIGTSGQRVRLAAQAEIAGFSTSNVSGGGDTKSAMYYKLFAPVMFRSKRKAISPKEVRAHVINYPGVADCRIFTQRDIAPNDPKWQNVMRVCILPTASDSWGGANPNPQSAAWSQFEEWLLDRCQALAQLQRWNATKLFVKVRVLLAITEGTDPNETRIAVTENILKVFQRKPGILGRRLSLSDIESACKIAGVDYVEIESPIEEIIPQDGTQYVVLDGTPEVQVVYTERKYGVIGAY